jgi:membrane-associated phospholipid phosphatase
VTASDGTRGDPGATQASRAGPPHRLFAAAVRAGATTELLRYVIAIAQRRPRAPLKSKLPWPRLATWGLIAAAGVAISMAFLDAPVFGFVSALPQWVVDSFYDITDFGRSGWILLPVAGLIMLIVLIATRPLDPIARAVLAAVAVRLCYVFVAVGLPGLVNTIVKRWIGRERPSLHGPFIYEPFSWRAEFASFPSGHATTAFAALVAIGGLYPRARPVLWAYALLIAISRVAVAAHYPSDVIAGAVTGAFGALWVRQWFASRGVAFYAGADGSVHNKPGPSRRRIAKIAGALLA